MTTDFTGKVIKKLRPMNQQEMEKEGWEGYPTPFAIELESGEVFYPSRDDEGNGPGALFLSSDSGELPE